MGKTSRRLRGNSSTRACSPQGDIDHYFLRPEAPSVKQAGELHEKKDGRRHEDPAPISLPAACLGSEVIITTTPAATCALEGPAALSHPLPHHGDPTQASRPSPSSSPPGSGGHLARMQDTEGATQGLPAPPLTLGGLSPGPHQVPLNCAQSPAPSSPCSSPHNSPRQAEAQTRDGGPPTTTPAAAALNPCAPTWVQSAQDPAWFSPPVSSPLRQGVPAAPLTLAPVGAHSGLSPTWSSGSSWGGSPTRNQAEVGHTVALVHAQAGSPSPKGLSLAPVGLLDIHPSIPPSLTGTPPIFRQAAQHPPLCTQELPLHLPSSYSFGLDDNRPASLADLKTLTQSLPTKNDISILAKQLVEECKQEFAQFRTELAAVSTKVDNLEVAQEVTSASLSELQSTVNVHTDQLFVLQQHMDDIENRNRRNNLRVRGLPESVASSDLFAILSNIFNDLLEQPPNTHIELDRAHRALRPPSRDDQKPRDVCHLSSSFLLN